MIDRRARRRAAEAKAWTPATASGDPHRGHEETSSALHEERLDAVVSRLLEGELATVLDLGCGSGSLLRRLAPVRRLERIVGLDSSLGALRAARRLLAEEGWEDDERVELLHRSLEDPGKDLAGFDAAALVETIEHIDPVRLSVVERAVFGTLRPKAVILTTPNREYNVLYGMAEGELRHADHHFEWDREKFRGWAQGVAERNGYLVEVEEVGLADPVHGSPTQMAVFRLGAV